MDNMDKIYTGEEHTCDVCGNTNHTVKYVADPFLEDVHNEIERKWMCDECYCESLYEI